MTDDRLRWIKHPDCTLCKGEHHLAEVPELYPRETPVHETLVERHTVTVVSPPTWYMTLTLHDPWSITPIDTIHLRILGSPRAYRSEERRTPIMVMEGSTCFQRMNWLVGCAVVPEEQFLRPNHIKIGMHLFMSVHTQATIHPLQIAHIKIWRDTHT